MRKKVILTQAYQQEAIDQLEADFDLLIAEDLGKSLKQLLKENPDTEAIISYLSDPINHEILDLAPNLKIVANYAVGFNNIDVNYAQDKGVYVTNTPDILTNATADLTIALILAVARRIIEADEFLRQGKWKGWRANLLLGKELFGCSLGIIGMGRIGLATALRARSFGMEILYFSRSRKLELEQEHQFIYRPITDLVQEADVITLHIPSSTDTHHLFNRKLFGLMKREAIFINVSRGDLVDEKVLADKLEKKELYGAGLDVYEFEPKVTEKLKNLKNVVLIPHLGSATYKTRLGMAQLTVDNVKQALSGKVPKNLI
jgi:glyoxylate reductase